MNTDTPPQPEALTPGEAVANTVAVPRQGCDDTVHADLIDKFLDAGNKYDAASALADKACDEIAQAAINAHLAQFKGGPTVEQVDGLLGHPPLTAQDVIDFFARYHAAALAAKDAEIERLQEQLACSNQNDNCCGSCLDKEAQIQALTREGDELQDQVKRNAEGEKWIASMLAQILATAISGIVDFAIVSHQQMDANHALAAVKELAEHAKKTTEEATTLRQQLAQQGEVMTFEEALRKADALLNDDKPAPSPAAVEETK